MQPILEGYYSPDSDAIGLGNITHDMIIESISNFKNVLWIGEIGFDKEYTKTEFQIAKMLRDRNMNAEDPSVSKIKQKVAIVGESLIKLIDSFDLKDPAPVKEKRVREEGEEEQEEGEEEEEVEGEEEEEDEFDDDISSREIRRIKKKANIDQITEIYNNDDRLIISLLSGRYFEEHDRVNQNKRIIVDPDDIDFPYLGDI